MRNVMRYIIFALMVALTLPLQAQKGVRENVRKGNKAYRQQKFSEAFTFYSDALGENPSSPEANYNAGNTLYRQKEWDKSAESYQQYLSIEKENPKRISAAWHNIGNALLQKKELEKSMEAYKMGMEGI
jgi:tetratricopeptide (TPR) repeat protein